MPLESSGSDRVQATISRELLDRLEMLRELVKVTIDDVSQRAEALEMLETDTIIDRGVKSFLDGFVATFLQDLGE